MKCLRIWSEIRKVWVLLYDLCHISIDRTSEVRTLNTTNELYISGPYFTDSEVECIRAATVELIDVPTYAGTDDTTFSMSTITEWTETNLPDTYTAAEQGIAQQFQGTYTIEGAIKAHLLGFLDKRKASGDSRPCGPHDLGPIYKSVFGVSEEELKDEKFLSRLRRSGLGDSKAKQSTDKVTKKKDRKEKGKTA